jgi:hypothetical protein
MGKKKRTSSLKVSDVFRTAYGREANGSQRLVIINGVALGDDAFRAIENTWGATIPNGVYWYDPFCGAWGMQGGPCVGFCTAGLQLGGPLRRDASNGQTGVLINGRELNALDLAFWQHLGLQAPGCYWLDAQGNYGVEGWPMMGNLVTATQATSGAPWTHYSRFNRFGTMGGDGKGFLFYSDGKHFWSTG